MNTENKTMDKENEELIAVMVGQAEKAEEPEGLTVGEVIHKGDKEVPVPMVAKEVSSAGYYWIYDTRTGDRSKANRNMLPALLKAKREDGSLRFIINKPPFEPELGKIKCLLHKDSPNRAHYDEMGLPVCNLSCIPSKHALVNHMRIKHKTAWEDIEHERTEAERQEDRAAQRALYEVVAGKAGTPEAPLYVSDKPKKVKKRINRR